MQIFGRRQTLYFSHLKNAILGTGLKSRAPRRSLLLRRKMLRRVINEMTKSQCEKLLCRVDDVERTALQFPASTNNFERFALDLLCHHEAGNDRKTDTVDRGLL